MHARRIAAGAAAAAAASLALTGCSLFGQDSPDRDPDTQEILEEGDVSVYEIRVGDCLDSAELSGELNSVPVVPCGEPHDAEIYDSVMLSGDEFPGEAEVGAQADEYCVGAFESFVGVAYEDSELYASTILPSADSWNDGDREVLCVILDSDGGVTGSMRDAGR